MNSIQIISQIINGIGTILNAIGINIKNKSKTLLFFTAGNICVALALGLLHAKAGMIVQIIFVIESTINYFLDKKNFKYPIWLIGLYVLVPCCILTITFSSFWDILPILVGIFFPLALISKNFLLRLLNLFSVIVWIPYLLHFGQYVGAIGCTFFTILNIISIIRFDIINKKIEKTN